MNILKKLLGDAPTAAAEIAKALETARADRTAASAEQTALADRRADALVSGSDAVVDKIEAEQTATARKLDRLDAVIARLEARHSEAAKAENAAAVEAKATDAQKAADDLASLYSKIDSVASDLKRLLAEAAPLAKRVDNWNRNEAAKVGRPQIAFKELATLKRRVTEVLH